MFIGKTITKVSQHWTEATKIWSLPSAPPGRHNVHMKFKKCKLHLQQIRYLPIKTILLLYLF